MQIFSFFNHLRRVHFCRKRRVVGRFAGPFRHPVKKKMIFFTAVGQRVGWNYWKNMKKNFAGTEKGRIFAPAFERRWPPGARREH